MGKFEPSRLLKLNCVQEFKTVIETGSLFGDGTETLSKYFPNVHTIEIQPDLWTRVSKRFEDRPNITCHFGDSAVVLRTLVDMVHDPVVFFLDAHWSGNKQVDWNNSLWKGYDTDTGVRNNDPSNPSNQNPLDEELQTIVDMYKQKVIIYIDDMEKFDAKGNAIKDCCFQGEDWSHLSVQKILDIVKPRMESIERYHDQLILVLREHS